MMVGGGSGGDLWRGREWCAGPLISFMGHPFSFVRSRFIHVQSFCSCAVILIHAWSSSSFEWSWWTVSADHSSCCLSGVVVFVGAC